MPNWCYNKVTFKHADIKQLQKLARAWNRGKLMQGFLPCPKPLQKAVSGFFGDKEKQAALEKQHARNVAKYGHATWYDWSIAEWGTKWDVGRNEFDDRLKCPAGTKQLTVQFDSAWSPPVEFYTYMTESEGFDICAYYYEGGMGFAGKYASRDGDKYYDFPGTLPISDEEKALAELEKKIPADVVDALGLADELISICESAAEEEAYAAPAAAEADEEEIIETAD